MNNINVIAYKSDRTAISMGCVVDTFSSDFIHKRFDNVPDACKEIAAINLKNSRADEQDSHYDVTVLFDGVPLEEIDMQSQEDFRRELRGAEIEALQEESRKEQIAKAEKEATAAREAEEKRQKELNEFFATGKRLGFDVTPHPPK